MSINYVWSFTQAEVLPEVGALQNVVNVVHWRLTATDEDGVSESCYGSIGLHAPNADSFTPFTDLTKDQVEAWVEARLNESARPARGAQRDAPQISVVDKMKNELAASIAARKNPPSQTTAFGFGS